LQRTKSFPLSFEPFGKLRAGSKESLANLPVKQQWQLYSQLSRRGKVARPSASHFLLLNNRCRAGCRVVFRIEKILLLKPIFYTISVVEKRFGRQ